MEKLLFSPSVLQDFDSIKVTELFLMSHNYEIYTKDESADKKCNILIYEKLKILKLEVSKADH